MSDRKTVMKSHLARIEKYLAQVVGVQKIHHVTPEQFLEHAASELQKARTEPIEKSRPRLSLLYKSVLYSSSIIEDTESDNIKIPVFVVEQTTFAEQSSETMDPVKLALSNRGGESFFEDGLMKGVAKLKDAIDLLSKGDDEEDEEKRKKAAEAKAKAEDDKEEPPPFPPKKKTKAEGGEDDEEEKRKKAEEEEEKRKKAAKASDDTAWPDDMNDKHFAENGERAPTDWGPDAIETETA